MSASTPLIPQAFYFRLALRCRRLEGIPRAGARGKLLDLPVQCALPPVSQLDGRQPWAEIRTAWNPDGLAVAVTLAGKATPLVHDPANPDVSDGVQVWIDTRDTRDIHRASRFCHRFAAGLRPGVGDRLEVYWTQRTIARAQADPPRAGKDAVLTYAEARTRPRGWHLELFFRAAALHGFDPDTCRRLGFLVQVSDPDRGEQLLGLGRELPVAEDPSLWTTLELVDA